MNKKEAKTVNVGDVVYYRNQPSERGYVVKEIDYRIRRGFEKYGALPTDIWFVMETGEVMHYTSVRTADTWGADGTVEAALVSMVVGICKESKMVQELADAKKNEEGKTAPDPLRIEVAEEAAKILEQAMISIIDLRSTLAPSNR